MYFFSQEQRDEWWFRNADAAFDGSSVTWHTSVGANIEDPAPVDVNIDDTAPVAANIEVTAPPL
jgi:hypothetical protein